MAKAKPRTLIGILGIIVIGSTCLFSAPPSAVQAAAISCPAITRTLYKGVRGSDVSSLQTYFVSEKLLSPESATGYFGGFTELAVKQWQAQNNIVASGAPGT